MHASRFIPRPVVPALLASSALCLSCSDPEGGDSSQPTDSGGDTAVSGLGGTQAINDRDFFYFARESIEAATRRVHVIEYMIYNSGTVTDLLDALAEAAARGVEVRVLADEEGDETAAALSYMESASGGSLVGSLDSSSTTTHNKLIIADDVALVGSHNFSSSALGYNNEASMYVVDTQAVDYFERYFQALWLDSDADPQLDKDSAASVVPIKNREIDDALAACIADAQSSIRLVLYALCYRESDDSQVNSLTEDLADAHQRGIDVQVVLDQSDWIYQNDINDEAMEYLLGAGVPLRNSPRDVTTHAKMLMCDSRVIVGDANWSYSSFELYNGTSVQVEREDVAAQYEEWFQEIWQESEEAG